MTVNEIYEVKAEAFRIMTGHMAPGKDPPAFKQSASFDDRFDAFDSWIDANGECILAMLTAFERIMEDPAE